jgi:DNA gyrase subunit A
LSSYRNQSRGGKGSLSSNLRTEDFLEHLFIASTHDYILFVSSEGKAYWMKVHEIPEGSRTSRGPHIKTLLAISANEEVTAVLALQEFSEENFVFMATSRGVVKKVTTSNFTNARTRGIIAIKLDNGDKLVSAKLTSGENEVVLVTRRGYALRFHEENVRAMGRATRGVLGIRISDGDELAAALSVRDDEQMVLVSEFGYGKRIQYDNFSPHGRGTRGQISYKANEKTGELVGAISAAEEDEMVCITSQGKSLKLRLAQIPIMGKTAMGVRVVNVDRPDFLVGIGRVVHDDE